MPDAEGDRLLPELHLLRTQRLIRNGGDRPACSSDRSAHSVPSSQEGLLGSLVLVLLHRSLRRNVRRLRHQCDATAIHVFYQLLGSEKPEQNLCVSQAPRAGTEYRSRVDMQLGDEVEVLLDGARVGSVAVSAVLG